MDIGDYIIFGAVLIIIVFWLCFDKLSRAIAWEAIQRPRCHSTIIQYEDGNITITRTGDQ